jgi:hypothetical protein
MKQDIAACSHQGIRQINALCSPQVLILVSKAAHCLNDLLFRQRSDELPIEVLSLPLPAVLFSGYQPRSFLSRSRNTQSKRIENVEK